MAAFLVVVLNWVGQDYFAPQAVGLVLAVAAVALAIAGRGRRVAASWCALPVFGCLVLTHQLTPFWVLLAVWALVLLRMARAWVGAAMTVLLAGYLVAHLDAVASYGLFSGLDVIANARTNIGPVVTWQQEMVSAFTRATALGLWAAAAAAALWAWRTRRPWMSATVVGAGPMALLLAQGYGGEALLRVFLYSLAAAPCSSRRCSCGCCRAAGWWRPRPR
ncbi:hypothetical protein BJF78_28595 [Pseudonocardia sp. CNS-139]|nr:hypothetical protein BJF78_28595 [Pseudonocardia sp. CNS-139]